MMLMGLYVLVAGLRVVAMYCTIADIGSRTSYKLDGTLVIASYS